MKYWMIKDGNSEGPFSLEELTAHGLAAETKVWRQGLPQWTEARLVPEFAPLSLLYSPFFYLLLPLSWLSIRSAVTARRMLRAGNIEAAMKRADRTVLLITLNAVVAITLFPFHVVAEIFW